MKALIFDTETGGLDPEVHSVFSVGALVGDLDTGEIIDRFEAYHKLPSVNDYVYVPKAVEIHGITPEQAFEEGISTQEIADKFMDMYQDHGAAIIGGHNIEYDVRMMAHQIYSCSVQEFEANFTYRKLDSLPIVRIFTSEAIKAGATLTQATKWFNIDTSEFGKDKFHAALFDSICAFKLMHKFRTVMTTPEVAERLKA